MRVTLFKTAILLVLLAWPAAASAQIDFSGEWRPVRSMDNTEDPWIGDWVGLPLNDVGRARAEAWNRGATRVHGSGSSAPSVRTENRGKTPQGVRNTAMSIYTIRMAAEGFKGRPR
jgi:hypothetical protein